MMPDLLTDARKVCELLEQAVNVIGATPYGIVLGEAYDAQSRLVAALEKWISVNERLPAFADRSRLMKVT